MPSLCTTEQQKLAEGVASDSGIGLDYFSFIEIVLSLFEDIAGFETTPPELDLLNELWRIYCTFKR